MLTGVAGWGACVGLVLIVWVVLFLRKGPVDALGPALVLSFAFPVWLKLELGGIPFGVRSTVAVVALLGYAFHPRGKILSPLTLLDICVGLVVISHVCTDSMITGLSLALPFRAYGEWAIPFVAGRYAIRDRSDMNTIAKWVAGVLIFLSVMSVFESVVRVNPFEIVFGNRPEELARRTAIRLDYKRSFGTCMHAIYFGMAIASLSPWVMALVQNQDSSRVRRLGWSLMIIVSLGLLATVSRTPVLAYAGMLGLLLICLKYKWLKIPSALVVAVVVSLFVASPGQFADTIAHYTGGGDRVRLIEVEGEAEVVSGVRGRILIWKAYRKSIMYAGVFGYGSEALSTFPPRIPYLEGKAEQKNEMKLVDNGYAVTVLRFGWLGLGLLVLLLGTGILVSISLFLDRPDQYFLAAVAAFLVMYTTTSLMLVSNNYDFYFIVLWTLGILSGLSSKRIAQRFVVRQST